MSESQVEAPGVSTSPPAGVAVEAAAPTPGRPSLKSTAQRAAKWALIGYGGGYFLRMLSSVIITRLVAKEMMGVLPAAQAALDGLGMFSDLGIIPSMIRHPRAEEPTFQNTAWTIQVLSGLGIAFVMTLLAWPYAKIIGDDRYILLFIALGGTAVVNGMISTSVYLLQRHLAMSKVTMLELGTSLLGTVVSCVVAWKTGSYWAVVCGMYANCLTKALISHFVIPHITNRFLLDREAIHELVRFGKWILMSSAVSFVSRQSDRVVLPRFSKNDSGRLQLYNVAVMLSDIPAQLADQMTRAVLFPAYSRIIPQGVERVRDVYYRTRLRLDMLGVFLSGGVMGGASWIVGLLYESDYADVAWIMRALSLRAAMACILIPCENVLFSMGHSRYGFYRNCARAVGVGIGIPLGWTLGGFEGFVYAMALTEVPVLLVLWPAAIRHRVFRFSGEMRSVVIFAAGLLIGLGFAKVVPPVQLGPILRETAVKLHLAKPKPAAPASAPATVAPSGSPSNP